MWHSVRSIARAVACSVPQELFAWVSGLPEHEGDGLTSISCGGFGTVRDFGWSRWMLLHFGIWSHVVLTYGHISDKIAAAAFRRAFFKPEAAVFSETSVRVYQTTCWTMWRWNRFSTEYFGFPLSISFHQCAILSVSLLYNQRNGVLSSHMSYSLRDYSTCFGCSLYSSSGVH